LAFDILLFQFGTEKKNYFGKKKHGKKFLQVKKKFVISWRSFA